MEAGTGDDEPPNWPDEAAESAFLAETKSPGEPAAPAPPTENARQPLPSLDECVQRVPADAREALEELFRARFVHVRRVPASALKRG